MRSLLALAISLICATASLAQSAGDVLMSAKGEGGGLVPVWVTKSANKVIGWDGSGNLVPVTQATPTWGHIDGSIGNQDDLQEALAAKLSINAATGLYQPLNAQLSAIGALSTTAFGRGLLTAADAAAARTAQGLGTLATQNGTLTDYLLITTAAATYQPLSEQLTLFSEIPHTPFGRALLNVADAEALRTAADVPEIATQEAAETGESNTSLMTPLRTAQAIASLGGGGGGSPAPDTQFFRANGTWANPSPAVARPVRVRLQGGGGGGGSGARNGTTNSSTSASGGGGGGSGAILEFWTNTLALGEAEAVVVGTGGAGGAPAESNDSAGANGSLGGSSTFNAATARGGNPGSPGTTATASGGAAITNGHVTDLFRVTAVGGGSSSVAGTTHTSIAPTGGGGGGGITAAEVLISGGAGGALNVNAQVAAAGPAGGVVLGSAGTAGTTSYGQGLGGGGGACHTTGSGGAGGAGGFPSGGGGGGGGCRNGSQSGAGGNGGDGYVLIITY